MLGEEENFETGGNKTLEKVKTKFFFIDRREKVIVKQMVTMKLQVDSGKKI